MSQFDYFGTWEDSWEILDIILNNEDVELIPDMWYETSIPLKFKQVDENLKNILRKKRRLFILGKYFSIYPPCLKKKEDGPMIGKYNLYANYGGPSLDLSLPVCFEKDNIINFGSGILSYPKEFLNPHTGIWENSTQNLKDAYKRICSLLKKHLIRHKINSNIWIGNNALTLLKAGKAQIYDKGV
jgi:hypothetical protein